MLVICKVVKYTMTCLLNGTVVGQWQDNLVTNKLETEERGGAGAEILQRWNIARAPRACWRKKFGRMRKALWKFPRICRLN